MTVCVSERTVRFARDSRGHIWLRSMSSRDGQRPLHTMNSTRTMTRSGTACWPSREGRGVHVAPNILAGLHVEAHRRAVWLIPHQTARDAN